MTKSSEAEKDDTSWIDELPDLPEIPTGDQRQFIMIPKRVKKEDQDNKDDDPS